MYHSFWWDCTLPVPLFVINTPLFCLMICLKLLRVTSDFIRDEQKNSQMDKNHVMSNKIIMKFLSIFPLLICSTQ